MKRLLLIVMGVLLCTPLYSDMNPYIYGVTVASAPACSEGDYLVIANFEEAGAPTGWTSMIDPQEGAVNFDDTTSTVGRGLQQLAVTGGTTTGDISYAISPTFTVDAGTTTDYHFKIRFSAMPASTMIFYRVYYNSTLLCTLYLTTTGYLRAELAGASAGTDDTHQISVNEWHNVWVTYTPASGGNATLSVYLSNDEAKPESALLTRSDGSVAGTPNNATYRAAGPVIVYYDQCYIDDSTIGSVCE